MKAKEGLGFSRFILVLSSLSPLFILWAVRGVNVMPDRPWIALCFLLFVLPNVFLLSQIARAREVKNVKTIEVLAWRDQREHLLVYLFAMLLPLYSVTLDGYRELSAVLIAFLFIAFLFWHMRLHYMNIFLAMAGCHIFTVDAAEGDGDSKSVATYALISKRPSLAVGEALTGYRLGGNVLMDAEGDAGPGVQR